MLYSSLPPPPFFFKFQPKSQTKYFSENESNNIYMPTLHSHKLKSDYFLLIGRIVAENKE